MCRRVCIQYLGCRGSSSPFFYCLGRKQDFSRCIQIITMRDHPTYQPTNLPLCAPSLSVCANLPASGVHHGRVLSTDVGGPQADVRGPDRDFEAEQPDGDQSVDTRHLLQERQEVCGPQHDGPQQAVPHHEERHHPVHHEVPTCAPSPRMQTVKTTRELYQL